MKPIDSTDTIGTTSTIGIIGCGNMGAAMALRLLDCGYPLEVRDIIAERAQAMQRYAQQRGDTPPVALAASARDVALHTALVIVCVVDAAQTREVLLGEQGLLAAARDQRKLRTVMLCPTIAPADTEAFAAALHAQGIATMDAPMSGGPARAREGSMSLMIACERGLYDAHQPLLARLASRCFYVSEKVGDGARTKLVNNLLASINLAGAAECMALAQQLKLDLGTTLQVIEQSSGQSWIGSDRLRRALAQDTTAKAHMSLLAKDSALAVNEARRAAMDSPMGEAAAALFARACAQGLTQEDDAALLRLWQKPYTPMDK